MAETTPTNGNPDNVAPTPRGEEPPHKPADDRETIYFEGSPLLRAELGTMMLSALITAVMLVAPFLIHHYRPDWLPVWAWILFFLVAILAIVVPVLVFKTIRYRISNYRIDYERGILRKRIDTLELWHVEDISFEQSLIDRMLNVGTVTVLSHDDTTPKLELAGLPNARPIFESLKQRVIAVKRQRGVIKMDIG